MKTNPDPHSKERTIQFQALVPFDGRAFFTIRHIAGEPMESGYQQCARCGEIIQDLVNAPLLYDLNGGLELYWAPGSKVYEFGKFMSASPMAGEIKDCARSA